MLLRLARFADPVTRAWAVVAAGSGARLALGFVASILIARSLGPEDFAVFAVLAATSGVAGAIADLGLSDAGVKRVAEVWPRDPGEASTRGSVFFWLRASVSTLVVIVGCLLAVPLSTYVLRVGDPFLLVLALVGVLATALSGAVASLLQASRHFRGVTAVMLVNSGLTAVLAVVLVATGALNLVTALVILGIGTSVATFGLGRRLLPAPLTIRMPGLPALRSEGNRLFSFGLWLWIGGVFAALAAQLDLFLVKHSIEPATVGFYALALSLASKAEVANHSLYTVLLPSASSLAGRGAVHAYLSRGLIRSVLLALILLPLFPLAGPLIELFYGRAFSPAAPIFQLLLGVALLELFATPLQLLVFALDRPQAVAAAEAARAGTLGVAGLWLIPLLGPVGAVGARFASRVVGLAVVLVALRNARMTQPEPWGGSE